VVVVWPAATTTEAGTVRAGLFADSVTVLPPAGAADEIVTVHVALAPEAILAGEHCKPVTDCSGGKTVMDPLVPVTQVAFPLGRTPTSPPRDNGTVAPLETAPRVTPTMATTPLLTEAAFIPVARHVMDMLLEEQLKDLPALVNAFPATAVIEARLPVGYEMVHCRPAGWLLLGTVAERFRNRELP
jgi:hypothetical protein